MNGMWAKARRGEINGFTGYDSEFQEPDDADLVLDSEKLSIDQLPRH